VPAAFFSVPAVSIKIMTAAWAVDLQHADKLVLLALADNANDEGMCYPSLRTVATKCGMHPRTVLRAIESLESEGHLSRDLRPGRSTVYFVHPRQRVTGDTESHVAASNQWQKVTGRAESQHPGQKVTTPVAESHSSPRAPLSPPHTPPLTPHTPHLEPSENHHGNQDISPRTSRAAATAKRLPPDFVLTPERRAIAIAEKVDPEREFSRFCDHWRAASGANARKHDWDAAWRNWCRRAGDMSQTPGRGPAPTPAAVREQRDREELERLKAKRADMGLADFRDPYPHENPIAYETALRAERNHRGTRQLADLAAAKRLPK
jgi:DNA-binding transcriptional regulator YhcF (GntR family)